ncbi:MAG: KUP/HAK/KT family potassium transporter [Ignavibacteriaceae bacterium]|nr:KUP/HAK/KT family potassium transporter [Ignavibacteriaceae bacterium]
MKKNKFTISIKEVVRAMGIVFGDIGTSPIYTLTIIFFLIIPTRENVLGVLSLIFWTLIIIVTIQYAWLGMSLSIKGEGGIIVLKEALVSTLKNGKKIGIASALRYLGISLILGDGMITPAISILSAVEGLELIPKLGKITTSVVIIITCIITVILFSVQARGVDKIAKSFGPIMVIWFTSLFVSGIYYLFNNPSILEAVNPYFAVKFLFHYGFISFLILSDVILCATGGEALYADMGHLGGKSIRYAWVFVFLALFTNYFGQGAFLIQGGSVSQVLFSSINHISPILYLPFLLLALLATIIASQAMISAVMALIFQGINLRIFPLMKIKYTSTELRSQIYIESVNWLLLIAVLVMIFIFQSSENLSAAYGLAVTATMTISATFMVWIFWNKGEKLKLILSTFVLLFDLIYLVAVFTKIPAGGYWSLIIAFLVTLIIQIWIKGSEALRRHFRSLDLEIFITSFEQIYSTQPILKGEAIFFARIIDKVPPYVVHCILRSGIIYEKNILFAFQISDEPYGIKFFEMKEFSKGLYGLTVSVGYMQILNLPSLFKEHSINEKVIFYGVDDIKTKKFFYKIYAFIKKITPSFASFYNFPYNKLHGVVTRHEL